VAGADRHRMGNRITKQRWMESLFSPSWLVRTASVVRHSDPLPFPLEP